MKKYSKERFLRMLEDSFLMQKELRDSRLEFLGDVVFDFTTYDGAMSEIFAYKALEVVEAISQRKTFAYIEDEENYLFYLMFCNMPFFADKIEWCTSIRGAWWDAPIIFKTCGLLEDGEQVTHFSFSSDEWVSFMEAAKEFAAVGSNVKMPGDA